MLYIATSFLVSAMVIIGITILAEILGTKLGGIIGTLPHIIVVAYVFIALNRGVLFAAEAVEFVPAEMGINILFLLIFAVTARRFGWRSVAISLTVWVILSAALLNVKFDGIIVPFIIYLTAFIFSMIYLEVVKGVRSHAKMKMKYSITKIGGRGLLAGTVIAVAVFFSNIDSALSGVFSVFSALFLSTMLISLKDHGPDFLEGLSKSMIFGTPSVLSFAFGVFFFYPPYGILWGTLLSLVPPPITVSVLLYARKWLK